MKKTLPLLFVTLICSIAAYGQDRIYWSDQDDPDKVKSVNASDLGSALTPVLISVPSGIAYYHANPTYPLFIAASAAIYHNNLAGSSVQIITPTGQFNRGVAIDYVGKKIYWANSQNGYIGRADLDGSNKNEAYLTGLNTPWDIEIDPVNGKIYWTEDVAGGNIKRANLSDGSNIESVISGVQSLGVAVDPLREKIYFTLFPSSEVYSANINGSGTSKISGVAAIADIDVDFTTGILYMVDYQSNPLTKVNPDGTNKATTTGNGTFITYGDVTVPAVSSISRQNPSTGNVANGGTASFRVTFSEPVLNLGADDFELTGTPSGTITVNPVSLHMEYDVIVSNISGTGSLDLNIASTHDIFDFRGNKFGGSISAEETFTVIAATGPVITSFDPVYGPEGTSVTITGTNLSAAGEDNSVTFNGTSAAITFNSATSITTTVPAGATTGPIAVTVYGLTTTSSNNFTVCTVPPVPTITRTGNTLTSSADTGNQWLKNGVEIPGAISTTFTPLDPGDYKVRATTNMCSSLSAAITVTEEQLTPVITEFSPASGQRGSTVVITGTNFSATPASNSVTFNGISATVSASTLTTITTTVPAATPLGAGTIAVTVNGRTATSTTSFTVMCTPPPKPVITTDGGLLTSSSNTNNQWLKNGVELAGATNKTFTATTPGAYSVRVTIDGCSTESDPTTIVGAEETLSTNVHIYPNPVISIMRVEVPSIVTDANVEIHTMTGVKKESIVLSASGGQGKAEFNVAGYPSGMYLMIITTREHRLIKKFCKR